MDPSSVVVKKHRMGKLKPFSEIHGRREWTRTIDLYRVKVAL